MRFLSFLAALMLLLLISIGTASASVVITGPDHSDQTVAITNQASAPLTFSGSNDLVTQPFSWDAGLMIVQWTVNDGLFFVDLIDTNGKTIDSPVIQYDEGPGSTFVHVPSTGQYSLKVTASSPWTVTLSNTLYTSWETHWDDTNDVGTYMFYCTPGRLDVAWTVNDGLFFVDVVDTTGKTVASPVIQYDEGPGSTAVHIERAGYYMLKVKAGSPWTVTLSGVIQVSPPPTIQPTTPPTTVPTPVYIPSTPVPVVVPTAPAPVVTTPQPVVQPWMQPVANPVTAPTLSPNSGWGKRYTVGDPGTYLGTRAGSSTAPTGTSRRVAATTGTVLKPGSKSYGVTPPASGSFARWYPAARWAAGIR